MNIESNVTEAKKCVICKEDRFDKHLVTCAYCYHWVPDSVVQMALDNGPYWRDHPEVKKRMRMVGRLKLSVVRDES
jgi:hypothetical protein